jgi:ABC-2 type transport system ATP-binding protein
MAESVIHAEGLSRTFAHVRALDDLDLDVPAGVVFGFLGPNGAGKTTAIRLFLGLLEPSAGSARVLGFDVRRDSHRIRERAGALLEHHGLYERLSAEDNLGFYARAWKLGAGSRDARIRELLEPLGLWERRREPVGRWSRGMKQKLAVARALLHRPSLLFLDEPTAGLDPLAAAALRDDLGTLVIREGVTVFLTTHNLAEAERLCARVAVIKRGRLLAVGHPDDLTARRADIVDVVGRGFTDTLVAGLARRADVARAELIDGRLAIELAGGADVAPLVSVIVQAGVAVEEVRKQKASLEDVFLTLMEEET